ncbi:MAG TPA: cysteine desulfurase family protein [Stenomitos sp.]
MTTPVATDPVYLDYNASAPLDPDVLEAMRPYLLTAFGNSRSSHVYGQRIKQAIAHARDQVAHMLGCEPAELIFTSGGSEANNLALKGLAWAYPDKRHLVVSSIEHYSVAYAADFLATQDRAVTVVGVDRMGRVDPAQVASVLRPDTLVVSVQHANNEIGTVQDVPAIARRAHAAGTLLHCDAAQSIGKLSVRVPDLEVDLLTLAGHKFGGPQGIGALYRRHGVDLVPLVHGAGHEDGLRSGTHSAALIVGLGKACELVTERLEADSRRMRAMHDRLYAKLKAGIPDLVLNGDPAHRLPHTLNVSFPGIFGGDLLERTPDVAATTGAACHSGVNEPSLTMRAVGAPREVGLGAVRLSLGRRTTESEIDRAAEALLAAYRTLRPEAR